MNKTTIKDVAKLAGVSTATVSNVINSSRNVNETTKKRVLSAIRELNYQPSVLAKSMKGIKSKIIALIIPLQEQDSSTDFFTLLAAGVEQTLNEEGYQLVISNSHENVLKEINQLEMFLNDFSDYIDGVIIAPTAKFIEDITGLGKSRNLPTVYVDRDPRNESDSNDVVETDNYNISVKSLEYLVCKESRDLYLISSPIDVSPMLERERAFKDVYRKYFKGNVNDNIIVTESTFESGYLVAENLLDNDSKKSLFITNNTIAMGIFKCFVDRGISIPERVSMLVYDDLPWMEVTVPEISAIRQPAYGMGAEAAKLLINKLKNSEEKVGKVLIPSELIIRKSITR